MSLFPFLIVSTLLVRSGGGELLGGFLRPAACLAGAPRALRRRRFADGPCGRVLRRRPMRPLRPSRTGRLSPQEAASLLPACICSGPSFVILTVGEGMLGQRRAGGASVHGAGAGGAAVGGCPQPAAPSGKSKASWFRPFARRFVSAAAPPAGRSHRGRRPDLLQTVRVHPVFPAAGRRFECGGTRAGPACRHAAGSVLGLRPGFPGGGDGPAGSAVRPSACRGRPSCCRCAPSARLKFLSALCWPPACFICPCLWGCSGCCSGFRAGRPRPRRSCTLRRPSCGGSRPTARCWLFWGAVWWYAS